MVRTSSLPSTMSRRAATSACARMSEAARRIRGARLGIAEFFFAITEVCAMLATPGKRLDHALQPNVTRFHALLHAAREHASARLSIGQGHAHGHQCAAAVGFKN